MKQNYCSFIRKARSCTAKVGPLALLSPEVALHQVVLHEARIVGATGVSHALRWTVATIAGLGAYDTVAGATAVITQLAPSPGTSTVPATAGEMLNFVVQVTGVEHPAAGWQVTGTLPAGLVHQNATNNNIDSINGTPMQSGNFPITITAWEKPGFTGEKKTKNFTLVITGGATPPTITSQPGSPAVLAGTTANLGVMVSGDNPTFQWYHGDSGDTSNPMSGANTASLMTPVLNTTSHFWVRVTNPGGSVDSATAVVTVIDTFASWRLTRFSPAQLADSSISAADADPDQDHMTNEEEFIHGKAPLVAEQRPSPMVVSMGGELLLTFEARRATGPGYAGLTRHYALESANNPATGLWTSVTGFGDVVGSGQTESYTSPFAAEPELFRLRVWLAQD